MPTYTYRCKACGKVFDQIRKISERKTATCECGIEADLSVSAPRTIVNGYFEKGRAFVR